MASITCDITSGGVRMAAAINAINTAYLRFLTMPSTVIIRAFANNNNKTGNSKAIPKAKINRITRLKYSEILGSTSIESAFSPPAI